MLKMPNMARPQHAITSLKPAMRYPLATAVTKPTGAWKPFYSSLIDTVAVLIDVDHSPLRKIARRNPQVKLKGNYQLLVPSPFSSKITARVFSREMGSRLMIEASIPKFLTGQNIVGREDLLDPCLQMIFAVLEQLGIVPNDDEIARLERGQFQMTRIDYAIHCDCGSPDRAKAVMAALRSTIFAKSKDASAYGDETIYSGQHSRRKTLRIYRKDLELKTRNRGMPANVYRKQLLTNRIQNCVRFELVLRSPELKRLGLEEPGAWSVSDARQRMRDWNNSLRQVDGVVPNIDGVNSLTNTQQLKLRLWLAGDLTVFASSPTTFAAARKAISASTGIDIRGEPGVEVQRRSFKCLRDVLQQGIGFKNYSEKWDRLVRGVVG
jgi:Phage replication protein CRI